MEAIRVNKEHFWREIILIYNILDHRKNKLSFDKEKFFEGFSSHIKNGGDFEIIDGDNNLINFDCLKSVFNKIHPPNHNSKLFVISILGPQSTGKSTLLNMLLNSKFPASAGKCTNGLSGTLFKTNYPEVDECLVLDSEGLLSMEREDEIFDKKLTIYTMALSHVMLINVNGEINESMKKIISLSMYAAQQLKISTDKRAIIFFVLRNMIDVDKSKQREMMEKLQKAFDDVAETAGVKLNQIVDYRHDDSFDLMYSAFEKTDHFDNEKKLFSICLVNPSFRNSCQNLRNKIFKEALINKEIKLFRNLEHFLKESQAVWDAISSYNDFLQLNSIKEVHDRKKLLENFNRILDESIEKLENPNSLKSKCNKIKKSYKEKNLNLEKSRKEIQNFSLSAKTEVTEKFKNDAGDQFSKELVDEFIKLLKKQIDLLEEQFLEDLELAKEFFNSQELLAAAINSLNETLHSKIINFKKGIKNEQYKKNELIKESLEEFELEFTKKESQLLESFNKSKKNNDEVFESILENLFTIAKSQISQNNPILDSKHLDTCSQDRIKILSETLFFQTDYKKQQNFDFICKHMLDIVTMDEKQYQNFILNNSSKGETDNKIEKMEKKVPNEQKKEGFFNKLKFWESSKIVETMTTREGPMDVNMKLHNKIFDFNMKIFEIIFEELEKIGREILQDKMSLDISRIKICLDKPKKFIENLKRDIEKEGYRLNEIAAKKDVVQTLIRIFIQKSKIDEESNIKNYLSDFKNLKETSRKDFNQKLLATFGDKEKSCQILGTFSKNFENFFTKQHLEKFYNYLEDQTYLSF